MRHEGSTADCLTTLESDCQTMYAAAPMMIDVVAFACRGTLVDWAGAIETVAYELARRNGESGSIRGNQAAN